eukprot:1186928-Prorocentrum_minimum.AAC.4
MASAVLHSLEIGDPSSSFVLKTPTCTTVADVSTRNIRQLPPQLPSSADKAGGPSAGDHGAVLYDNWVFDIPKLLDICVLYGHSNPDLTRRLVEGVFTSQPAYVDDLAGERSIPPAFNGQD